jgi:DNA-binding NarL/FixJ family response regulator
MRGTADPSPERLIVARLTSRQREVLFLLCKGLRNREIAVCLHLSDRAVKTSVSELLMLFDVSTRTELAGLVATEVPNLGLKRG